MFAAKSIKTFIESKKILVLRWHENTLDMITIENVWECLKQEFAKETVANRH